MAVPSTEPKSKPTVTIIDRDATPSFEPDQLSGPATAAGLAHA
jgi:hypothetical protein